LWADDFINNPVYARQVCESADIIVIHSILFGPILTEVNHWLAHNKIVVVDFDEAYNLIPPGNDRHLFWHHGQINRNEILADMIVPPPLAQFKTGLQKVHAAIAPSQRLADDWSQYTDVHYLPNYIDLDYYENVLSKPDDEIIVGWGGEPAFTRAFSASGVAQALQRVCQARPAVKVMICGGDLDIEDQLCLPPEQLIHQAWVPYDEWGCLLSRFDIGIAPLCGSYDDRRSWIRVLEYMVMKIPWVASDGPAYRDLKQYGILVDNNPEVWEQALLELIDHRDSYRKEAAGAPYLFGVSQSIDANVERVLAVYTAILYRVNYWGNMVDV
jgi:glycosyltransferase involved in cell wall biosynthesis